jgi:hypothetical protein
LFNLHEHRKKLAAWLLHKSNNHDSDYHLLRAYLFNIWAKYSYDNQQSAKVDYRLLNFVVLLLQIHYWPEIKNDDW